MEDQPKTHRIRNFIIFLLILIIALILWSRFISTSGLIVKEYGITNNKLPQNFHGLKIIQFSDIHYGRTVNDKELKKIVKTINSYKPDLVFFTGDLIDKAININDKDSERIALILKDIDSTLGKYAVKGNHDYKDNYFTKIMDSSNFITLSNDNKLIYYKDETPIQIIGLPSLIKDHQDFETAFTTSLEENIFYKIVLAHEPDTIKELDSYKVNLMLSGHSHGGQVRAPFIGAIVKINGARDYYEEYYKVNETDLYISSGIGTSALSFRFLNKPSINLYRMYNN